MSSKLTFIDLSEWLREGKTPKVAEKFGVRGKLCHCICTFIENVCHIGWEPSAPFQSGLVKRTDQRLGCLVSKYARLVSLSREAIVCERWAEESGGRTSEDDDEEYGYMSTESRSCQLQLKRTTTKLTQRVAEERNVIELVVSRVPEAESHNCHCVSARTVIAVISATSGVTRDLSLIHI